MRGHFQDANFALAIGAYDPEGTVLDQRNGLGTDPEVAIILFLDFEGRVDSGNFGSRRQFESHLSAGKGTREAGNEQIRSIRIIFGMLRVMVSQNVSRILNDHVLDPPTSAQAGDAILPGVANRLNSFLQVLVGAAWSDPE